MKLPVTVIMTLCLCINASAQSNEMAFIDSLMAKMSVEDKIGQLNQIDGRIDLSMLEDQIRDGMVSSIMNIVDPDIIDHLQKIAMEESPSGIPIIFSRDVIHGFKTMLPIPLGLASTWNEEIVLNGARMAAVEASEAGIRWGFGPMIDVSRDSRWGRIAESFGEDALLNANFGLAVVKGYQTDNLSSPTAIAACAKHFVGYGAARGGRDYNGSNISMQDLQDIYLVPFRHVAEGGCASIMTSFQDNNGVPTTANSTLLKGIVRKEWEWDGVIVSDYGSIGQLVSQGCAEDMKAAAKIGITCGTDLDMMSKAYLNNCLALLKDNEISMEDIDTAVRHILKMKYRLGLFSRPFSQKETHETASPSHLDAALRCAEEGAVLLKNDGILPLDTTKNMTILLTGPMSDAAYDQLGTWNMDGDTTLTITPKTAFQKRISDKIRVIYEPGLRFSRDKDKSAWKHVAKQTRKADVIVVCLGEEQILSGEAHSLADIGLKGAQTEYVEFLSSLGKPVVISVMSGRANTVGKESSLCNAMLFQFHPGTMGGEALAKIVFGETNPSGKLPVTFPRMVGQSPIAYNDLRTGRDGKNSKAVNSLDDIPRSAKQSVLGHDCRYLDAGTKPLFPFGFGLSYSKFEISEPYISKKEYTAADTLRFSVTLSNTSGIAGKEVVQVYVKDLVASLARPVKELKAYRKVHVGPYEKQKVEFAIPIMDFGFHNIDNQFVVEPGEFSITISDCSDLDFCSFYKKFDIDVK